MKRLMTGIAAMTLLVGTGFAFDRTAADPHGYGVVALETPDGTKIHAVVSNEELKKLKDHDITKGVNVKLTDAPISIGAGEPHLIDD